MTDKLLDKTQFRSDLVALIPQMRAFARNLCRDASFAEDLAQDALTKAWASRGSFQPGTNLKAWTFMILRNGFYSIGRRSWRSTPLDQSVAENTLFAVNNPTDSLELNELRRAMNMLPDDQREALILVGAAGMSYEEAAEICGVPTGTVKSRDSRARARIVQLLADGDLTDDHILPGAAMAAIFSQMSALQARRAA